MAVISFKNDFYALCEWVSSLRDFLGGCKFSLGLAPVPILLEKSWFEV